MKRERRKEDGEGGGENKRRRPEEDLISAATKGHTEIVQELVRAGAALDLQDENTQLTVLMIAAGGGFTEIVQGIFK